MRGFDENGRNVMYNRRTDIRNNSYDRGNESGHEVNNGNNNRQRNEARQDYPDRKVLPTRPSEPMNYRGRNVGKPVKVDKQMRGTKETRKNNEKKYREK